MTAEILFESGEVLPEYYFSVERLLCQLFRLQMLQEQGHHVEGVIDITWDAIMSVIEKSDFPIIQ